MAVASVTGSTQGSGLTCFSPLTSSLGAEGGAVSEDAVQELFDKIVSGMGPLSLSKQDYEFARLSEFVLALLRTPLGWKVVHAIGQTSHEKIHIYASDQGSSYSSNVGVLVSKTIYLQTKQKEQFFQVVKKPDGTLVIEKCDSDSYFLTALFHECIHTLRDLQGKFNAARQQTPKDEDYDNSEEEQVINLGADLGADFTENMFREQMGMYLRVNHKWFDDYSEVLAWAMKRKHSDFVGTFIKGKEWKPEEMRTTLAKAAARDDTEMMAQLLGGAEWKAVDIVPALEVAVKNKNEKLVNKLLSIKGIEWKAKEMKIAFSHVLKGICSKKQSSSEANQWNKILEAFLNVKGADWKGEHLKWGLENAAQLSGTKLVDTLLSHPGADWKAEDLKCVLEMAYALKNVELINKLLEVQGVNWQSDDLCECLESVILQERKDFMVRLLELKGVVWKKEGLARVLHLTLMLKGSSYKTSEIVRALEDALAKL